jgi:protein subunit release factor A
MEKKLLFSVGLEDCKVSCFTVKGPGGSGKDTSNTGVRIQHLESGGSGVCVKHRSQHKNKIEAFKRMRESKEFKLWHLKKTSELLAGETVEQKVEKAMQPENLKVEVRTENGWEAE